MESCNQVRGQEQCSLTSYCRIIQRLVRRATNPRHLNFNSILLGDESYRAWPGEIRALAELALDSRGERGSRSEREVMSQYSALDPKQAEESLTWHQESLIEHIETLRNG